MSRSPDIPFSHADLGDPDVWEAVVRAHYDRVLRAALRETRRFSLAEEVAQDTFIRAFQRREQFDGGGSLASWLYRIAVNRSRDVLRRENIRRHADVATAAERSADAPDPSETAHRKDLYRLLGAMFEDAPEPMRRAFEHTVILGYTYREAAEIEGVSEGTIASRVARTRDLLARECRKTGLRP